MADRSLFSSGRFSVAPGEFICNAAVFIVFKELSQPLLPLFKTARSRGYNVPPFSTPHHPLAMIKPEATTLHEHRRRHRKPFGQQTDLSNVQRPFALESFRQHPLAANFRQVGLA